MRILQRDGSEMVAKGPSPNASSVEKTINNITKPTKTNKGLH